jgi:tRNA(adenine34) deaminase
MDTTKHKSFMRKALLQARVAYKNDEVPIGAVVVDAEGNVLSRAYNKMEKKGCQTGHAEIIAIQKACKKKGDWRLDDCWIYVTLEPCLMCFGLIQLSRMKGVVFGAKSSLFGFGFGSSKTLPLYNKDLVITDGIMEESCVSILKEFFKEARIKKGHRK